MPFSDVCANMKPRNIFNRFTRQHDTELVNTLLLNRKIQVHVLMHCSTSLQKPNIKVLHVYTLAPMKM